MATGDQDFSSLQIQLMQSRWPSIWRTLVSCTMPQDIVVERGRGCLTAVVRGIHLTSGVDRGAESRLQAEQIGPDEPEAWVYGLALGDLPRTLLQRRSLRKLHIVVMDGGTALFSLTRFEHLDWLADERVEFHLADELSELKRPFCVSPACLRIASGAAIALRDALVIELAAPSRRREQQRVDEMAIVQQEAGRDYWTKDPDVRDLFGHCSGKRAVVVGGGPTLSLRERWFRANRDSIYVVAVSTALRPLAQMGVIPDVAVVIESREGTLAHMQELEREKYQSCALIYVPGVRVETLEKWGGRRFVAYLDLDRFARLSKEMPRGTLFCSGTVVHVAVDFAVQAGADEVILVGTDFSYPMGKTHARGAHGEQEIGGGYHYTVKNGHGESIASDPNLIMYLRDLELYVSKHAGVKFYTLGLEGARIEGTRILVEGGEA